MSLLRVLRYAVVQIRWFFIKAFVLADDVGRVWFVRGSFLLHVSDDPLGDQLRNLHRQPRSQAKRHRVGNSKLKQV